MTQRLALPALFLLLLTAAFFQLGCDSADNPIAPSGSTLSISANPSLISLDGDSATLTITGFKPDGNPLNPNTQLTISTSLGVLRASNNVNAASINLVTVGDNGRATAYLFGDGRQGTATVTVALTSGTDATEASTDVQIGDDSTSQPTVTLTANPTSIALNETSTITITARNPDQSPLAGAQANVRTSLGSLSFNNGSVTNSNGVVTLTLRSSESGTATVTASVGSSAEETVDVEIGTSSSRPTLTLSANPRIVDVLQQSTITMTIRDENGNFVTGNRRVFLDGNLGGLSTSASGNPTASLTVNVSGGRGTVVFTAGDVPGTGGVTGFVENSDEASVSIDIRDAPAGLVLTPRESSINRGENDTVTLDALVTDSRGNRVTGEIVTFGVETAGVPFTCSETPCAQATGGDGVATVTLTFEANTVNVDNFVVFAEVRGGNLRDESDIDVN